MNEKVALLLFCLSAVLPIPSSASEGPLMPCESVAAMSDFDLALMQRVSDQLSLGSVPDDLAVRIVFLPDFSFGEGKGQAEWVVSVLLPDRGEAVLTLNEARGSIRGANTEWLTSPDGSGWSSITKEPAQIPVSEKRLTMARDLAIAVRGFVSHEVVRSSFECGGAITVCGETTSYLFVVKRGFMICGTLRSCALSGQGERLRRLANLLRDAALSKRDAADDTLRQIADVVAADPGCTETDAPEHEPGES